MQKKIPSKLPLLDLSSTVKSKKLLTFNLEKISQNYE